MLNIDGSTGEGGGQVLRTALALALVTGQPFRIEKIRSGRRKPGLLHQHLTAVRAAAAVGNASVDGAELGSLALTFRPGAVRPGDHHFSVGTAGSATLVLQTILPALATAGSPSHVVLEGGTHNPAAPPFDFIARSFLPALERMGPRTVARLQRRGFFPAGGGRFEVDITPAPLEAIEITERGELRAVRARAIVAHLPRAIGERELNTLARALGRRLDEARVEEDATSAGPGNVLLVEVESTEIVEVCTAFGRRGVPAEQVAATAADEVRRYIDSGVPVGPHLADQLLVPLAVAGGGVFVTGPPTPHAATNASVIERFLPLSIDWVEDPRGAHRATVGPRRAA